MPEKATELAPRSNPNGKPNSDVLRRSVNAKQVAQRRELNLGRRFRPGYAKCRCQSLREALRHRSRASCASTPCRKRQKSSQTLVVACKTFAKVSRCFEPTFTCDRHTLRFQAPYFFVFLQQQLADHQLAVIARSDDTTFGILHSRFHEIWSLSLCTWLASERSALYPDYLFRNLPLPTRPDAARHRPRRRSGFAAVPGRRDCRRQHRRCRPPPERTARSLAQPGRVGRLGHHPGRGKSRLPETPGRQTRPRSRPQEAHPDQPLQRPPRLARPRPQGNRQCRRRRLRLDGLRPRNPGRRNPPPPAGAESGTEPGVLRLKLFNF